jgi:hypothetical protein
VIQQKKWSPKGAAAADKSATNNADKSAKGVGTSAGSPLNL